MSREDDKQRCQAKQRERQGETTKRRSRKQQKRTGRGESDGPAMVDKERRAASRCENAPAPLVPKRASVKQPNRRSDTVQLKPRHPLSIAVK